MKARRPDEFSRKDETPTATPAVLGEDINAMRLSLEAMLAHATSRHPELKPETIARYVGQHAKRVFEDPRFQKADGFISYTPSAPLPLVRLAKPDSAIASNDTNGKSALAQLGDTRVLEPRPKKTAPDQALTPLMPPAVDWTAIEDQYWETGTPTNSRVTNPLMPDGAKAIVMFAGTENEFRIPLHHKKPTG